MKATGVVPSCATFTATALTCARCDGDKRLVSAEPHPEKSGLEIRTYRCDLCDSDESYLIHL